MKNYCDELNKKKEKLEEILANKLFWFNRGLERIEKMEKVKKDMDEVKIKADYLEDDLKKAQKLREEDGLIIEALQEMIDGIDRQLRTWAGELDKSLKNA